MFKKKVDKVVDIDSLIGEDIKIIGKIEGSGNLRIDGTIQGDIDYKGDVVIGENGTVEGNISCGNISLAGAVNGNIKSTGKLVLLTKSKLIGDVEVLNFIVHEDAFFEGNCKMIDNNKVKKLNSKETKTTK